MNQSQSFFLSSLVFLTLSYGIALATDTNMITIKNLSPAKLTITVKNDPDKPTMVVIPGNDTGSVLVNKPRLQVHIEANYDGKILKTNFKRRHDTENYWEIKIRKAIIGGIQLLKRDSR